MDLAGSTGESPLLRQLRDNLQGRQLGRVVWVADRGFSSGENRAYLSQDDENYLIGEKLRASSEESSRALSWPGRYREMAENLQVKEVVLEDDRFVICYNPEQAVRDAAVWKRMLQRLEEELAGRDQLVLEGRSELLGRPKTKPGLGRLLRVTKGGLLRVDRAAVEREPHLDGKPLVRSCDPNMTADATAPGFKQLLQVDRGWRNIKTTLALRPVYPRKEERILAHIVLCWLALLLIRVAENQTGETWSNLRNELKRLHPVTLATDRGTIANARCSRLASEPSCSSSTPSRSRLASTSLAPERPDQGQVQTRSVWSQPLFLLRISKVSTLTVFLSDRLHGPAEPRYRPASCRLRLLLLSRLPVSTIATASATESG